MEQKKFDLNSFIGLLLLGAIMLWFMYNNQEEVGRSQLFNYFVKKKLKNLIGDLQDF